MLYKIQIIDILCIIYALKLIYEGTARETKKRLDSETKLKEMINYLPDSMYMRTAVLLREGYVFDDNYCTKFTNNNLLSFIPTNQSSINEINKKMNKKFPNWSNKEEFITNTRLYVKNQSYFKAHWENQFNLEFTDLDSFYIGDNKAIEISIMIGFKTETLLI